MFANSDFSTLKLAVASPGVASITMARPEVFNAFDETMIGQLHSAFEQLIADSAIRVIVLAGEGKHFSAGADLNWMQRASHASFEWNLEDSRRFVAMLACIESSPKPTIARIQGAALGGGVGLACACDFAVAVDNAVFSVSEAKFGILPSVIGPYVTNAVGKRQAKRLALTATRIKAQEAMNIGLVQQVVSITEIDAAIAAIAAELLAASPNAQREIKQLFAQLEVGAITADVRELTAQTISRVRGTKEAKEGFAAFLAKRPPNW
jgi:methylglutaconyl-CoA hydratase